MEKKILVEKMHEMHEALSKVLSRKGMTYGRVEITRTADDVCRDVLRLHILFLDRLDDMTAPERETIFRYLEEIPDFMKFPPGSKVLRKLSNSDYDPNNPIGGGSPPLFIDEKKGA